MVIFGKPNIIPIRIQSLKHYLLTSDPLKAAVFCLSSCPVHIWPIFVIFCKKRMPRTSIPHICRFFTHTKFLENKIYTEKRRKLRQNTQKIANFLRYNAKYTVNCQFFALHLKKFTPAKKNLHGRRPWRP